MSFNQYHKRPSSQRKRGSRFHFVWIPAFAGMTMFLFIGCAKERPIKQVLPEIQRVDKSFFTNDNYYYNVTVVGASADAPMLARGEQSFGTSLITWEITEQTLTAYLIDPRYKDQKSLKEPIISFPIDKHVDIELYKNMDEEETHIQEETTKERPWKERKFAKINFSRSKIIPGDILEIKEYETAGCITEMSSDLLKLDQDSSALNLNISKTYRIEKEKKECDFSSVDPNTFSVELKLSFLKETKNPSFNTIPYEKGFQQKVGTFYSTIKKYGQFNEPKEDVYVTHWDPTKKIIYILSKDFPKKYKHIARKVFHEWNEVIKDPKIAGKPLLELRENQGEEYGDLRYNIIEWIEDPIPSGLLGFGPSHWNPFTGETINASTVIYAGNFKETVREILDLREKKKRKKEIIALKTQILPLSNEGEVAFSSTPSQGFSKGSQKEFQKILSFSKFQEGEQKQTLRDILEERHQYRCYYRDENSIHFSSLADTNLNEEELFETMITVTFLHEMGHNLGLRHNFKGSLDKKHFSKDEKSSSVMDYFDLKERELDKPGAYDKAALRFALKGEFDFSKNYLYCTDEDVIKDPFCNRWDQGTSAAEIAQYLVKQYFESYEERNTRGRKIHFYAQDPERYQKSLFIYHFLPLREFLDYFLYIQNSHQNVKGDTLKPEEAQELSKDLFSASLIALRFFYQVIMDNSVPYLDIADLKTPNELLMRGSISDKIVAAHALTYRGIPYVRNAIDPWSGQKGSFFDLPPRFQDELLHFLTNISLNAKPYIAAIVVLLTLDQIADRESDGFFSSASAAKLFEIHEIQNTQRNRSMIENKGNTVEFFMDEENDIIIYADRTVVLTHTMTPAARLIKEYTEAKNIHDKILGHLSHYNSFREEKILLTNFLEKIAIIDSEKVTLKDIRTAQMHDPNFLSEEEKEYLKNFSIKEIDNLLDLLKAALSDTGEKMNTELNRNNKKIGELFYQEKRMSNMKERMRLFNTLYKQRSLRLE